MRNNLCLVILLALLTGYFCGGCIPGPGPIPSPTTLPEITSVPTQAFLPTTRQKATSMDVLNACPVEEQAQAMRANQVPDWQNIGIFACYQLALTLSESSSNYSGTETLTFNNYTGMSLNEIVLRVFPNAQNIYNGKMSIQSARMGEEDLSFEYFLSDQTGLRIHLNHPLLPENIARINLEFNIEIPQDFDSDRSYGILNQSTNGHIINLANWYPILAVFENGEWQANPVLMGGDAVTSQTALFKVAITAPETWQIASTGTQIQQIDEQDLSKHIFVSGPVRDFMVVASPSFDKSQVQVGDIAVIQWGASNTKSGWDTALEDARSALTYYEDTFGPYPFNELDIVATALQNASGVEYPGLVLIIDGVYQSTDRLDFLDLVIAHEIAHQWWYSIIGNDVLQDPWQDEALATYSSLMYLKTTSPGNDYVGRYQSQVSEYDKSNPGQSIGQPLSAFQSRLSEYGLVVYLKGALFFDAVRSQIGDEAFVQALKTYYRDNKFQLVRPDNLLNSFTQACGCSLAKVEQDYGLKSLNP